MADVGVTVGEWPFPIMSLPLGATVAADTFVTFSSAALVNVGANPDDFPIGITQAAGVSGDTVPVKIIVPIALAKAGGTVTKYKLQEFMSGGLIQNTSGTGSDGKYRAGFALETGVTTQLIKLAVIPIVGTLSGNLDGMS